MQKIKLFFIMLFVIVMSIFSCILPYPIFSNYTNLTEKNAYEINNYQETELKNSSDQKPQILDIDWFSGINVLLPIDEDFEIIDIKTEQSIFAKRIGGKNHADIETSNTRNSKSLHEIVEYEWKWDRRPVLVKLNEHAYLPASLSTYPHGFHTKENGLNGHFCLHFKGSKTHGTQMQDDKHQNSVEFAKKHGEKIIQNQI